MQRLATFFRPHRRQPDRAQEFRYYTLVTEQGDPFEQSSAMLAYLLGGEQQLYRKNLQSATNRYVVAQAASSGYQASIDAAFGRISYQHLESIAAQTVAAVDRTAVQLGLQPIVDPGNPLHHEVLYSFFGQVPTTSDSIRLPGHKNMHIKRALGLPSYGEEDYQYPAPEPEQQNSPGPKVTHNTLEVNAIFQLYVEDAQAALRTERGNKALDHARANLAAMDRLGSDLAPYQLV